MASPPARRPLAQGHTRLRLERMARRWEQDDVAAGLVELAALLGEAAPGVDANLVSKWERGVRTPGNYYSPRLCLLFQLPPEQLGFVPGPRLCSECRRLSGVLGRALVPTLGFVRRREFLQHLLWGGAVLAAGPAIDVERILAAASGHVDRRLVDDLHILADDYLRRRHTEAPRDLLPQVERHLAYVRSILRGARPQSEEDRLHLVAGTLAAVCGRLSFDLGNPGDAHAYYLAAEGHAREAREGPLLVWVLGQRSHLYSDLWRDGKASDASMPLELLDEAHAVAGDSSSPSLRTWLATRRAEEHAIRGDARAALRDLDEAERLGGAAAATDDAFFAHWRESPHLAAYRGNCLQLLGRTGEAAIAIEDSLAVLSPSLVFCRCSELVDLATVHAEEDVERSCALLAVSLDLCSENGLVAPVQRVAGVRKRLARWHDTSPVRHLDERLHDLAWPPA
jgi:transcriptional regulator with XRE-family HTH domain